MLSPFPGMDPFIESQKWEDFHTRFVPALADALVPVVRPKYIVDVQQRVYLESHGIEIPAKSFIAYVGIHNRGEQQPASVAAMPEASVAPKSCTVPFPEEHRESFLTIRLGSTGEVVAVIELLSPTNKLRRADGRQKFLEKRSEILQTNSHFVELDLLRGGEHMPFSDPPDGDYFALVSRVKHRPVVDVYGWKLDHRLPTIPVPLAEDDPDVPLELQTIFELVYDRAGYDYALDYCKSVSPALTKLESQWLQEQLAHRSENQAKSR